jgi:DNA-binding winged helix-turn-helix (wHTH) protein
VLDACTVYPSSNVIRGAAGESTLQPRIMKVLVCLAEHAPQTVTRQELLERGWEEAGYVSDEALTKVISHLRKTLRHRGCRVEMIRTVPKTGYRLVVVPARQATNPAVLPEERASTHRVDGAQPPARVMPSVRRRTKTRVALAAGVFVVMTGVSFFVGSHLAASSEPQIRMVRRVMHLDPSLDEEALLRHPRIDTLFINGEDARRIIEGLNAGESFSSTLDTDS